MEINMVIPVVDLERATQIFTKAFSLTIIRETDGEFYPKKILLGIDPDHPVLWLEQIQDLNTITKRQLKEALRPYLRIKPHDEHEYDKIRKAIYVGPSELSEEEKQFAEFSTYLEKIGFKYNVSPPDGYVWTPTR